jgi:ADP-heptose:LPS heptosyltransferase
MQYIEPGRIGDWVLSQSVVHRHCTAQHEQAAWMARAQLRPLINWHPAAQLSAEIPDRMSFRSGTPYYRRILQSGIWQHETGCVLSPAKSGWLTGKLLRKSTGYVHGIRGRGRSLSYRPIRYHHEKDHLLVRTLKVFDDPASDLNYEALCRKPELHPRLDVPPGCKTMAQELIANYIPGKHPFIMLCTGARWENRKWPVPCWIALCRHLVQQHWHVVMTPTGQATLTQALQEQLHDPYLHILPALELDLFTSVLAASRLLICVDSGPMHLGAALGVPLVCLYGPSAPALTGPVAPPQHTRIIQAEGLSCRPCITPLTSFNGEGISCEHNTCMQRIAPEQVLKATMDLYRKTKELI